MAVVTQPTRVLLVDDDGNEVEPAVDELRPDVVLMDIRMPGMDGLSATEILRTKNDAPQIIVLTTFDADEHVLRALRAGASGFLLKDTPPADIIRAIQAVAAGEPILSPAITRRLIGRLTGGDRDERRRLAREQLARLTERERDVAVAIGLGKTNAEISRELYISVATVKAQRHGYWRNSGSTTAYKSRYSPTTQARPDRRTSQH